MAGAVWKILVCDNDARAKMDSLRVIAQEREAKGSPIPDIELKEAIEAIEQVEEVAGKLVKKYLW